jgi:hypothetical protein
MQEIITTLSLASYPIVAICLFAIQPFNRAILWTVLLAQLLLPVGPFIKFDKIPQFDKNSIPCICLLVICVMNGRLKIPSIRELGVVAVFALMFLLGPIGTSYGNGEALQFGPLHIAGVGFYDAISALINSVITLTPYFIGRALLREELDNGEILRAIIFAMLAYSIPLLFEVRFSPQLHYWVYGTYPSMFLQSIRDGAFRPMVFMGHGLVLAHFVLLAFIAAAGFWRARISVVRFWPRLVSNYRSVAIYLGFVVYFCRTLGALLYVAILAPLILFSSAKSQIRVAVAFAFLALLYPTMRYFDVVPTQSLVKMANSISEDRGQSLGFRFDNEGLLLDHALKKPYFGWGRFGRNRVYDSDTGKDLVVTDGEWIIALGQFGAVGFVAEFGLLCMSVFRAAAALRFARSEREKIFLSVLALMVATSIFDLLPNAFLEPWTWLMAGGLLGRAEALLARKNPAVNQYDQYSSGVAGKGRLQAVSDQT